MTTLECKEIKQHLTGIFIRCMVCQQSLPISIIVIHILQNIILVFQGGYYYCRLHCIAQNS